MVLTLIHDLIDFTKTILPGVCKQKAMLLFVCGCECVSVCVCVYTKATSSQTCFSSFACPFSQRCSQEYAVKITFSEPLPSLTQICRWQQLIDLGLGNER
ncbi:unnamed protein product [Arctogadus glacialis]